MSEYASVSWCTEDIHNHRKECELEPWTEEQVEEWLSANENRITDLMITRGWDYIYDQISE